MTNKHLDDLKSSHLQCVYKQLCSPSSYDGTPKRACILFVQISTHMLNTYLAKEANVKSKALVNKLNLVCEMC